MYLYGASGHAKVILDILKAQNIKVEGLIDDNVEINGLCGYTVYHGLTDVSPVIVSIGINETRKKIVNKLNCEFGKAVHPSAVISPSATIGEGTVVMQGAIIQVDVKVGRHCIINTGSSIDHECIIGDFCHISPHATLCGNVSVGEGSWIGAGTIITPGVRIGKWCVIGAGSLITRDIPDNMEIYDKRDKIRKELKRQ
jgi:sugar O-acyltransferase (sialic acid O-acetyltransferase NeuD family)